MTKISTSKGELTLRAPTAQDLEAVSSRWPFGLVVAKGGLHELAFSDPVGALAGLYLPQVPVETAAEAAPILSRGRAALARGLGRLSLDPEPVMGLLLASAVLRQEGEAYVPGLAFFVVPDPGGPPATGTSAG
ncbi:MAG: hypothetical protein JKY65_20090, partial [Planctomycetes bacterium]|nr:hypothetical protein [Planctomycetota bacterium]